MSDGGLISLTDHPATHFLRNRVSSKSIGKRKNADGDLALLPGFLERYGGPEAQQAAQIFAAHNWAEARDLGTDPFGRIESIQGGVRGHGVSLESEGRPQHRRCDENRPRFETLLFRIRAMSRRQEHALHRLRRKFWIRALRIQMSQSSNPKISEGALSLSSLSALLLDDWDELAKSGHEKRIQGVYDNGNDPHKLIRRIPVDVPTDTDLQDVISRKRSGPSVKGEPRVMFTYQEVPLNLVERAENLCPGSADWESAPLWWLAGPQLPELISLRESMWGLKHRVGLCNPSLGMLRSYFHPRDYQRIKTSSLEERRQRYSNSLSLLSLAPTAAKMSLLAALVVDSYLVEDMDLLPVHQHHFSIGVDRLLAHEFMADIATEFRELVQSRFMALDWEEPAAYHVPFLDEPFMIIEQVEAEAELCIQKMRVPVAD